MPETETNPDLILAGKCAEGCHLAQTELFETYRWKIQATCARITGNQDIAEDVTQEIFIQIFCKIGGFKGEAKLSTWIHRLAVNQTLMYLRKNKRFSNDESLSDDEKYLQIPEPVSENASRNNESNRLLLESCISQLPDGYRNVFVLHDVEGYEHEEVAKILGCSEGTSKSQLSKAKVKLRRLINTRSNPRVYVTPPAAYA
jgi:RNA polymerase sigma-70 factor (ECF subfamily)